MRMHIGVAIVLAALTFAVFAQTLQNGFVAMDDQEYVATNPYMRLGPTPQGAAWAFTSFHAGNWHPLTWLSHLLDFRLYALDPLGHHLTGLLLHIANVLLLFWVLCRMTGALWRSAFVAALFAVHPLHVESVAWIAERKDVLSTFLALLTIWAYANYARKPAKGRFWVVVGLFALGLMAKPMLVTLPLVLLLLDYWPLERLTSRGWRPLVIEKWPLFALSAASCIVTFMAQHAGRAVITFQKVPPIVRVANAAISYVVYLKRMIWPSGLACYYPYRTHISLFVLAGAVATLIVVTVLALRTWRQQRYLATGWLWYLITLVPVIGLVQVGGQSSADRYTYLPLIGIFVMIAWGVPDLLSRAFPNTRGAMVALGAVAGAVVLACAASAWVQVNYWKDDITLFGRALQVARNNPIAHTNLAFALGNRGLSEEAIEHYREAIRLQPDCKEAHSNLANLLYDQGNVKEAIEQCRLAIKLDPTYASAHNNLASMLMKQGKLDEAILHLREATRFNPYSGEAYHNLAVALFYQGHYAEAWKEVHNCRKHGGAVAEELIQALSEKMPDPGR